MGCASVSVIELLPDKYPPKPDDYFVPIYTEEPAKKYKSIAIIKVESDTYSLETLVDKLRQRAREIGADAILGLKDQSGSEIIGVGSGDTGVGMGFICPYEIYRVVWNCYCL